MKENKKSYLTEFDLWWNERADKSTERFVKRLKASPIGYPLFQFGIALYFLTLLLCFSFLFYQAIKPYPFEIEGSCNSGFIGIDYKSTIENQPYAVLNRVYDGANPNDFRLVNKKRYFQEYLPKELNLKNIDGLNCQFKIRGAIPLNILQESNW